MNKKQVIVIHGGDFFDTREEFFKSLKKEEIEKEDLLPAGTKKRWKENLAEDLGSSYEVLAPRMPLPTYARYEEWKVWFEKSLAFLKDGSILVGHSLGGIFLARYLSEEKIPIKAAALFLVAPFYALRGRDKEANSGWTVPKSLKKIEAQIPNIFIYHSTDDEILPLKHSEQYKENLPTAKLEILEGRGHIRQEHFPELVRDIKNLKKSRN